MNFVIYLLDGLTPLSIKSDQNKFFFGKKIKDNFLSKMKRKSLSFENAYGYGETYSTVYQLFTGRNIYDSYCDAFELLTSFPKFTNIPYYFRLNNFNTYMYSDASFHPIEGFYKRFFNSINNNFDEFCNFKKSPKYKFNNFLSELKKRKKINIKKKNNFYFFHDHSLHDSKYVYRNATPENYLQGVNYSSELIKENLKKINFNFKKDVLVFLSDHGLNIRPHDKMHFKEKISNKNYDNYYPHLYDDEKIKIAFWIYSPKLKKKKLYNLIKPNNINEIILSFFKNNFISKKIEKFIKKNFNSKKIIISLKAAEQDTYNSSYFKNYYHCHFIIIKNGKKLVYSRNHKNNLNDTREFKPFFKKYFGYRNFIIKFLLFCISFFYRLCDFIIRRIK